MIQPIECVEQQRATLVHGDPVLFPCRPLPPGLNEPCIQILRQKLIECFPQQCGKRRCSAARRNRQRHITSSNDPAQKRGCVCRVVDRIHENPSTLCSFRNLAVHVSSGCRDGQPRLVQIARLEPTPLERNARTFDLCAYLWRNHADVRSRLEKLAQLRHRHRTPTDEGDAAASQIKKDRKHQGHRLQMKQKSPEVGNSRAWSSANRGRVEFVNVRGGPMARGSWSPCDNSSLVPPSRSRFTTCTPPRGGSSRAGFSALLHRA